MATGVLVHTVVFDQAIYKPSGIVGRWMAGLTIKFETNARLLAPERTGRLKAGIHASSRPVGERQVEGLIGSSAPYSLFVLQGTTGPIMTTRAWNNPSVEGGFVTLWGSIDPKTGKFTRRHIKGAKRKRHQVPVKGYWMPIPAFSGEHGSKGAHFAYSVRGQEANNFLLGAWRKTAVNHKVLRGRVPSWLAEL